MFEVKFAVVREDPYVEEWLVQHAQAQSILLVGSGGCTALHLRHTFPSLDIVAYDFNPVQLQHIEAKALAVAHGDLAALNVENRRSDGWNQCGAFERLFRILRASFLEWVASEDEVHHFFHKATREERDALCETWFSSGYWPAVFAAVFNDTLLHAMFGPDATQHAPPGSYPSYFQGALERGFRREDAAHNPFLQHIFLGDYKTTDAPAYLHAQQKLDVTLREGALPDMSDVGNYDVVHLSNIFDWSDDVLVSDWARHMDGMKPGAWAIVRQLNNERDLQPFLGHSFVCHESLGDDWQRQDRSLFYNRIQVWQKRT